MNNKIFKLLSVTTIGLVVIWILQHILYGNRNMSIQGGGFHMNSGMNFGNGYSMNFGYNNLGTFSGLLSMLMSILSIVFVIALVVAIIILVKNIVFTPEDVQSLKNSFTGKSKSQCSICLNELNENWKVCPYCGKEKEEMQK